MPGQPVQQNEGAVRPTLFLGLGGTGKEVLLRLRRRFYERLKVVGLPCTAYLWLDTDTRDNLAFGEVMDEVFSAVAFQPQEKVPLLHGKVGADLSAIIGNPSAYRHIHSWLAPEVARFGTEIGDGAGGVRAVGRLTYFNHFDKIDAQLRSAIELVRGHESINATTEFFKSKNLTPPEIVEGATQVVLVGSLAGGTGCGTFLDAAFHLKYLAKVERTIAMLFMPNLFYANAADRVAKRSYGNAYAALKELEYFTLRLGTEGEDRSLKDFDVEWVSGEPRTVMGPPFNIAYIMEMTNEGDTALGLDHRGEVFDVVAESLYLDFMPGAFSTGKRSHYSNVAGELASTQMPNIALDAVTLPQEFARRYATCGMSKIEIPVDRIKAACASRLAHDIAAYINRDSTDPGIADNVFGDMRALGLDKDNFLKLFGSEWKDKIHSVLLAAIPKNGVMSLDKVMEIEKLIRGTPGKDVGVEAGLIAAAGDDPVRWGSAIGIIRNQTGPVIQKVNELLGEWLRKALENDKCGLKLLVSERKVGKDGNVESQDGYLRYMAQYLTDLYSTSPQGTQAGFEQLKSAAAADAKRWAARRDAVLLDLREAVRSKALLLLHRADWVVETLLARLGVLEEQFCLASAETVALDCASQAAKAAVGNLIKRRAPLQSLSTAMAGLSQEFLTSSENSLEVGQSVLFIRFFDRERDWPSFYKLDVNEQDKKAIDVNPRAEYRKFLGKKFPPEKGEPTLWDLVELVENEGGSIEVRARILDYSEDRFLADFEAHPRQVDLLSHPQLIQSRQSAIERLVRSALPMARRDGALGGKPVSVRRLAYLGVPGLPEAAAREAKFVEDVRRQLMNKMSLGVGEINVLATGKPYEVYLYTVVYAFPLPALKMVTSECHDAYRSFYKDLAGARSEVPLHLSRQWEGKFEDLKVYTEVEAQKIKEAREALLFGGMLRVLDLTQEEDRLMYSYRSGPPLFTMLSLGAPREAVASLQERAPLRAELLQTLAGRERLLGKSLVTYYWALQYLSRCDLFPAASAEGSMLKQRILRVYARLLEEKVPKEALVDIGAVTDPAAYAKEKIDGAVDWVCGLPVLKEVSDWSAAASG